MRKEESAALSQSKGKKAAPVKASTNGKVKKSAAKKAAPKKAAKPVKKKVKSRK